LGAGCSGQAANVYDYQHISHNFWLLHGDLLDTLNGTDPISEGIDGLNVLDAWDSVSSVAEMFHIISDALIMLLLDGL
jgi:hypothetical protein